ncbi:probable G-protein coupled receptor Mth-like 5 [Daphnia pulicaria]|uniref:probable G-protein coupled receptor Mth-like 5 n=1 Tax=Daphnia pulicaria TaxID=35523 RepID=UPI001EEB0C6D|nr:probable G-protein coupled receptor Mth-like 5 [Daphnia pulicaria]
MSEWTATLLLLLIHQLASSTGLENLESEGPVVGHWIHVQKCCPEAHMMVEVASRTTATTHSTGSKFECQLQNDTSFRWAPDFLDNHNNLLSFEGSLDKDSADSDFNITKFCIPNGPCISSIVGKPQCGPFRAWPIFTYAGFQEDLQLRPFGVLRHVVDKLAEVPRHHEYPLDQYCVDGVRLLGSVSHFGHGLPNGAENTSSAPLSPPSDGPVYYALICEPDPLDESDFFEMFVRVFYPIGLGVGLLVLLTLTGIHLVLKELRDLSGCMLISLVVSMIVTMISNLILSSADSRPSQYLNLLFLESVVHGSDVAVHFWLSAIGHRAWTAVRYPRKEAMRPEGKRYVFYSLYSWGSAVCVTGLAVMVHFFIEDQSHGTTSPHSFFTWYRIGWLGLALFCSTCVFLFLVNIYVYFATRSTLSNQTAYGRTFHRTKGYFQAYTRLFLIIETVWIIQTFSWLQYPILVGLRILADIVLPFLIFWAALKGRRVMHLLKIRLQMSQCWLCRRCFPPKTRDRGHYYGEEMMALGTPI